MKRLSLDDFKMESNDSKELEQLSGGILGACHTSNQDWIDEMEDLWWWGISKLRPFIPN